MKHSIVDPYVGTNHDSFVQLDILDNGSRDDIIDWLVWNDSNGVYIDSDCDAEGMPRLTLETAREVMRQSIEG